MFSSTNELVLVLMDVTTYLHCQKHLLDFLKKKKNFASIFNKLPVRICSLPESTSRGMTERNVLKWIVLNNPWN